ncbi:hypothetical protein [Streptomyces specialis]|uniref:hypothetical protein n=1 Tax=Streptomyces specialis TaxID=498367 RepID=UPI00073E9A9D|nr:hypothetical protein [Streptomyces specialis]
MDAFLALSVFVAVLAVVMGFFTWVASLVRRRGLAGAAIGAAMASYDEAFRPTAHDSHYEIRAEVERRIPIPSPGGEADRLKPFVPVAGARRWV